MPYRMAPLCLKEQTLVFECCWRERPGSEADASPPPWVCQYSSLSTYQCHHRQLSYFSQVCSFLEVLERVVETLQMFQESKEVVQKSSWTQAQGVATLSEDSFPSVHWRVHIAPGKMFASQEQKGWTEDGTWCWQSSERSEDWWPQQSVKAELWKGVKVRWSSKL